MNSNIYKRVMKDDVTRKIKIFADVFNLKITGWSKKEIDEHTHRIELFTNGTPVGYIDALTSDISPDYPQTDMPFVLYTPIGKVTGHYSTHFQLFKYDVSKRDGEFEKFDGLFKIKSNNSYANPDYEISSCTDIVTPEGIKTKVIFNNLAGNYQVELERSGNGDSETARAYLSSGDLCIDHFHFPEFNKRENYAKIRMPLEKRGKDYQVTYEFLGEPPYTQEVQLPVEGYIPSWRKIDLVSYDEIGENMALFDERMKELIDEISSDLTLLANGLTPITVYDKLAHLCFYDEKDKFKLGFSGASPINTALDKVMIKK